ncbi:hypothetical protein QCA50_018906 [Cerrena zonata]|uniref:Uncharacterized protein n=1 Tax=Cerrena zonata TaxID=2478898 RepID=A0AAW0FAB2_9APHY
MWNHGMAHLEENTIRTSSSSDIAILARAQSRLLDQELAEDIRRCAKSISLPEANDYMMARLHLSPFSKEVRTKQTWQRSKLANSSTPTWWAWFPKRADHHLYEMLSYMFDTTLNKSGFEGKGTMEFWVTYESFTYVLFFSCHSEMNSSSAIWRVQSNEVDYFSWLSESFPHTAICLITNPEPHTGVCAFLSFYSAVTALLPKLLGVHEKLLVEIEDFHEKRKKILQQRPDQKCKEKEEKSIHDQGVQSCCRCNCKDGDAKPEDLDIDKSLLYINARSQYIINLRQAHNIILEAIEDIETTGTSNSSTCTAKDINDPMPIDLTKECFDRYGWSKCILGTYYTFLVLVLLAPKETIRKEGVQLQEHMAKLGNEIVDMPEVVWEQGESKAFIEPIFHAFLKINDHGDGPFKIVKENQLHQMKCTFPELVSIHYYYDHPECKKRS